MSTLIFPATAALDVARFPFAAAALAGTEEAVKVVDQVAAWLADPGTFSRKAAIRCYRDAALRIAGRRDLARQFPAPVSAIPVGMSPEDFYRSRFD